MCVEVENKGSDRRNGQVDKMLASHSYKNMSFKPCMQKKKKIIRVPAQETLLKECAV